MLLLLLYGLWADAPPRITTYSSDDDDVTLLLAARTDSQAFALLYQRYASCIFQYLEFRLANVQDAEDLSQQVFLQLYKTRLPTQLGKDSIRGWLFYAAHNLAIDHLRKKRSTVAWQHLPEPLHPVAPGDMEAETIWRDQCLRVRRHLHRLSPEKQELIALYYGANLSARAVAEILNKSPAAVTKMLQRTLQEVKNRYEI